MISDEHTWTVEARTRSGEPWTEWSAWVDRVTAEAEKQHAREEGYEARIVRALI